MIVVTATWCAKEAARILCRILNFTDYQAVRIYANPQTNEMIVAVDGYKLRVPAPPPKLDLHQAREWLWMRIILPELFPAGL